MLKEKTNYNVKLLSFLCPLMYFASYLTRKNYSIVMAEIIISEGITNSQASIAATLSLISYGVGQIISGILGDKIKPQNMIICGLGVTALMNLIMPLSDDIYFRTVIWFINGFAQSMLWPPLVRIMAATMNEETYNKVCVNVNVAGISATIFLYITASAIWIKFFSWKYVFFSSAVLCAVILCVWLIGFRKIDPKKQLFAKTAAQKKTDGVKSEASFPFKKILASGFVLIAVAIIMQGALRDGITDWVPTFIINTFNTGSSSAILKSVIIPIVGVLSIKATGIIQKKLLREELSGATVIFAAGFIGSLILLCVYTKNQYITLVLSALVTGCMHGVNFYLVCIVPARFEKYGMVSTMSGIINSLTYVGSAAATYGFGAVAENYGWNATIIAWCAVGLFGTLCCAAAVKPWRKFVRS